MNNGRTPFLAAVMTLLNGRHMVRLWLWNVSQDVSSARSLFFFAMPSFFIRLLRVLGLTFNRRAAPSGP